MSVIKIEDTKQVFLQIILTSKSSVPYMELRDKLFTEEQYIKQLAKYYCRIEKLNSMIEQSEKREMRLVLICMDVYLIVEFILS